MSVNWPRYGNAKVFRRLIGAYVLLTVTVAAVPAVAIALWQPAFLASAVPISAAILGFGLLRSYTAAKHKAQCAEIARSFAGLSVVRDGRSVQLDEQPVHGQFASRADAVRAAMTRGGAAVVIYAYERFFLLSGARQASVGSPVAFRNTAVADIVEATLDRRSA